MDFDADFRVKRVPNRDREGSARKRGGRNQRSRRGRPIVHAPTSAGYGLEDDIFANNSPVREGRPRLSSCGNDDSDNSHFSGGEEDSTKCMGDERAERRGDQKEQKRRQRQKDELAAAQQRRETECIEIDEDREEPQSSHFDGVDIGGYKDPEREREMGRLMQQMGTTADCDYQALVGERNGGESRPKPSRGKKHKSDTLGSLHASKPTRIRNNRRNNPGRSRLPEQGYDHSPLGGARASASQYNDPLDEANAQMDVNRPREKKRGKDRSFTQKVGGVMGKLNQWGNASMSSKRERAAEAAIKRQTSNESDGSEQPSSGEKRKSNRREGGPSKKPQRSLRGSADNAIDVDEDESGRSDKEDDLAAALAGCQGHVDEEDYGHLNERKNDVDSADAWSQGEANSAPSSLPEFDLAKAPAAPKKGGKTYGWEKKVGDMSSHLRRTKRGANSDEVIDVTSQDSAATNTRRSTARSMNQPIPRKNDGWMTRSGPNNPPIPLTKKERRKRSNKSDAMLDKIKSQGGLVDYEADKVWGYNGESSTPSSGERKSNQQKKKGKQGKRQAKFSLTPKRRTRSASRGAGKKDNEVITIDSSSEDESSVEASFDVSGSIAESSPKKTRSPGDRASIGAVRIAIGKKLFTKGCELSFQLGTRNPYILFSFLDGKGKKREHSVHLKDDELKELRYYIDGDDDADEANDIDDAMSVIAFRITPSAKNDFARYPNAYDPDESGGAKKVEKRYIVVELRDSDELQAMLAQMQEHRDLELWCGAESKIPAKELANYTKAFVEDNRKEKEKRLSVGRRTRSSGAKKEKKASENKLLLVYPFAIDESVLTAAAAGLTELGGDLLGVEGASQSSATGSAVEAEAADQSDGAGDVSESKGKSSRTHYITIREDDKDRLSPGQFLNDSLVDFWMRWISRGEPSQPDSNVHFFTSHFMTTLKDDGPEAVASWTEKKNINVFSKKLIFVPVNADLHWSLCVVVNPGLVANNFDEDISEDEEHAFLFFLDSLKMHSKKTYSKHIRKWLNCEWKRLKNKKVAGTLAPFAEGLEQGIVPMRSPKIPYQENGCDCGVFVCRYAYALYTMRHQEFTWTGVTEKPSFKSLITNGPAFQFGMPDIARIRVEMGQLIDTLSKHYLLMKETEKAKKRAAKKAAKQGDSTETGDADMTAESSGNEKASDAEMADAFPGNEKIGDVSMADASRKDGSPSASSENSSNATGEDVGSPEGDVEETTTPKEGGDGDAVMTSASSEKEETGASPDGASPSLRSSLESSAGLEASDEDRSEKEGDGDVAMSLSDEKENIENDSEDAGTQSGAVDDAGPVKAAGNLEESDGSEEPKVTEMSAML